MLLPLKALKPIRDVDGVVEPHQLPSTNFGEPIVAAITDEQEPLSCAPCGTYTTHLRQCAEDLLQFLRPITTQLPPGCQSILDHAQRG